MLHLSHATIKMYINGIRHMCLQFREVPAFFTHVHNAPRLNAVLNGVKRSCSVSSRQTFSHI